MRKILHFDSPREHYRCDAAAVWCFDQRFDAAFRRFLKRLRVHHCDQIRIAGGAKCFASPESEMEREFVLAQIETSIRLHETRVVILIVHSDCGAYGGLAQRFAADTDAERTHHASELAKAAEFISRKLPGVAVRSFFLNFEGVWEV